MNLASFCYYHFHLQKTLLPLVFFWNLLCFFISGMFGFRIDVNFRSLLKSSICFLDKGIPDKFNILGCKIRRCFVFCRWYSSREVKIYHLCYGFLVRHLLAFGYPGFQKKLLCHNAHFHWSLFDCSLASA